MNNVKYGLIVSHLQKNSRKIIGNFSNICNNINTLIEYQQLTQNSDVFISQLLPEKLGDVDKQINVGNAYVFTSDYSSFNSYIHDKLQSNKVDDVIITGVETQWCVMQSTIDFISRGYNVHIPVDAVGSHCDLEQEIALERLKLKGAKICTTKGIISESLIHDEKDNDSIKTVKWFLKKLK